MLTRIWSALLLALSVLLATVCYASPTYWDIELGISEGGGPKLGVRPDATDGYDGQPVGDMTQVYYGTFAALYRQTGPDWSGPTGFCSDFMAPIPPGTSKTWNDIYLWSWNWTPVQNNLVGIGFTSFNFAPDGYWAELVIDYVPPSLNYTGPTVFAFNLNPHLSHGIGYFPVQIVSDPTDPTQVTRMHLTVYAPEPSSAAAILAGLAGFGAVLRRRRKT
jgi:hypothetical protein